MSTACYFYRRWFLDGRRHIVQDRGPRLVWQDDAELLGCDFAEQRPRRIRTVEGRSWDGRSRHLRPAARSYQYGRLRLWRTRPLAMLEGYSAEGRLTHIRVDFATPLCEQHGALYQTDLYLDMFIAANGRHFLVVDDEELEQARQGGLIDQQHYRLVRAQQRELQELLVAGEFQAWLGAPPAFDPQAIPAPRQRLGRWIAPGSPDGWPTGWDDNG